MVDNLKNSDFFAPYETSLPVLLCSGLIFAVLVFTVTGLNKADKETKFLSLMFFLTAIPLVIEPINIMWHTGSYMSFPARYGFITVFLGVMLAAKELSAISFTKKSKKMPSVLCAVSLLLIAIFALWFVGKNIPALSRYVATLWGNTESLQGNLFLCGVITVPTAGIIYAAKRGALSKKVFPVLLGGAVILQGACSVGIYMTPAKASFDMENYQNVLKLSENIDQSEFYRVNFSHKLSDANMAGAAGFNSLSHYTSLNDATYMETAKKLGYSGYWMESGNWGGSIMSDALLGVKYTAVSDFEGYGLKENPYFKGLGFKVAGDIPEALAETDRLSALAGAFSEMTGVSESVTKYDIMTTYGCEYIYENGKHIITGVGSYSKLLCNIHIEERQTLYFDCYNGFSNNLVENINSSFDIYVNGRLVASNYPSQSKNGLLYLGEFENETVNITIEILKDTECSSFGIFGIENKALEKGLAKLEDINLSVNGSCVSGNIASPGKYFVSIPYNEDFTVTLNGEEIGYTKALSGFMAIDVENSGLLEITFTPKGFSIGAIVSLIFTALAILFLRYHNKVLIWLTKAENIVFGIFIGGFAAAVIAVYIIPIVASLSDGII